MNFTTLFNQIIGSLVNEGYGTLPHPPIDVVLSKRAAKDLNKNPILKAHFVKQMRKWQTLRFERVWEKLKAKRVNDKLNLPRNIEVVSLDLGGVNWNRAVGFIDDNNVFQIFSIMPHEAFNKIAVS